MKLRQNGVVSFSIRLDAFQARGTARVKLHLKSWRWFYPGPLCFVGWVEPTPDFVGFRCTQANLHFAGVIAKCETQQRPISESSPKIFFCD